MVGVTLILLVATRAETPADGIQTSFWGLAALFAVASTLIFGVPELNRERGPDEVQAQGPAPPPEAAIAARPAGRVES